VGCSVLLNFDHLRNGRADQGVGADLAGDQGALEVPDLTGADLTGVDLSGVDLVAANVDLANADLSTVKLTFALSRQPSFFVGGVRADRIRLGNFDADAKLDLLVSSENDNNLYVRGGNGDGTFKALGTHSSVCSSSGMTIWTFATGDFDKDGAADVAMLCSDGTNGEVDFLRSNKDLTFTAPASPRIAMTANDRDLALGDFNGDGYLDVAAVNHVDANVAVAMATGTWTYSAAATYATGGGSLTLASGRLDANVADDLVVTEPTLSGGYPVGATAFYDSTTSQFAAASAIKINSSAPIGAYLVPLHGATGADLTILGLGKVDVFLANASGQLGTTASSTVTVGGNNSDFQLADLNSDGRADLVVIEYTLTGSLTSPNLWVALNQGNGTFAAPQSFPIGNDPTNAAITGATVVALGDVNGDGLTDIVVANNNGAVVVFLNTSHP
jgi:hypothetical protein